MRVYHVYIPTNRYRTVLYTGVTGTPEHRLAQHARGQGSRFAARYRVTDLVYAEAYDRVTDAIRREKEIKAWRREKKLALIRSVNPEMKPIELR